MKPLSMQCLLDSPAERQQTVCRRMPDGSGADLPSFRPVAERGLAWAAAAVERAKHRKHDVLARTVDADDPSPPRLRVSRCDR